MQKKLLACLLVAPVAGTAMADISIETFPPTEAPSLTTTPGSDFKYNFDNGNGLLAPVGTGTVTLSKVKLYPGAYKLTLAGCDNIKLEIDGISVKKEAEGEYTFTIGGNSEKDVTVKISADNPSLGFGYKKATLDIVLDEATLKEISTALQAELDKVVLKPFSEHNNDAALKSEAEGYNKTKSDIKAKIDKIADNTLTLEDYNSFQLWNGAEGCTIATEISNLSTKVGEFNEKVTVANKHAESDEYYNGVMTNVVGAFEKKIIALKEKIANNEFLKGVMDNDLDSLQARLDEIEVKFNEAQKTHSCNRAENYPMANPYFEVTKTWANIQAKYDNAVADQDAWTNYMSVLGDFRVFYAAEVDSINAQKGVEGVTGDPFATKKGDYLKAVQTIFDANNSAYDGNTLALGSPAETLNTAAEAIKAEGTVRGEITAKVNEFKAFVEQQNTAYTAAAKEYKDLTDQFATAIKDVTVPTSQKVDYEAREKAVDDALKALDAFYKDAYGKTDIKAGETMWPEYQANVDAVTTALEYLKNAIKSYEGINGLATELDKVQAQIEENGKELDKLAKGEFAFKLVEKLGATKTELDNAIAALEPGQDTADIKKQIGEYEAAAKVIFEALNGAIAKYNGFADDIKAYEDFIGKKTLIIGKTEADAFRTDDENTQLKALKEKLAGFATAINAVTSLDNQACYAQAVILDGDYKSWTLDVAAAKGNFAQLATKANEKFAQGEVDKQVALIDELKKAGLEGIDLVPVDKLTGEMSAAETAVTAAGQDIDALAKCDTQLQDVVNHCAKFNAQVMAYKTEIDKIADVQGQLTAAAAVNDTTMDPAKTYFTKAIAGYEEDLSKLIEDLSAALYNESIEINADGTTNFSKPANTLDTVGEELEKTIKMNQANYDELLVKSQNVLKHIDTVIEFINKNCQNEEKRAEYVNSLNTIKSTDLAKVDLEMTGDFGKGGLNAAAKGGYINKYDAILEAASKVQTDFDGEVSGLNEATAGAWKESIAKLRADKDAAVNVYNAFYYDIQNKGYREFISDALQSHAHLFDYAPQITKLEGEIQKYIDDCNASDYVFSEDDFKKNALNNIEAMGTSIANDVDALVKSLNQVSADYWTDKSDYRGGVYTALTQSMAAAGMFDTENTGKIPVLNKTLLGKCPVLQGVIDSYNDALTKHTAAEKATAEAAEPIYKTYTSQMGFAMDAIADCLDAVVYNDNVEKALEAAADLLWNSYYKDFSDKAKADKDSVGTAAAYKSATAEQKEAATKAIQEVIDKADAYNSEATAEDANTLSVLQDNGKAALDGFDDEIEAILAKLAKQSEANAAATELYNQYTGDNGIIPGFNSDLQKLVDYAASLAADSQQKTIAAINKVKTAIEALDGFVNKHQGDLATEENAAEAESLKKAVEDAFNGTETVKGAYAEVREAETSLLEGLTVKVRVAYNNAKASEANWGETSPSEMEAKIAAAMEKIAGLKALTDTEFQTTAQGLETDLCNYLGQLEAIYTPSDTNPAAVDAQARLTKKYEQVKAALEAAEAAISQCEPSVQEEYAEAYQPIAGELANVQNEYSNAGNKVVALEGNFAADLDAVQKAIDDKKAEIEAANQAALNEKAIAANAVALQAQVDELKKQLEEIRSYLSTYQLDTPEQYGSELAMIDRMIGQMQTVLTTMVDDKTLAADTTLPIAEQIKYMLTNLNYNGHNDAVKCVNGLATTAINDARTAMAGAHMLAADREKLSAQLNAAVALQSKANQSVDEANTAYQSSAQTADDLDKFFAVVEQAITDLTKAENDARAVTEGVYNSEFTPGDVTLDPDGDVNITDVQQVLTWVGEGVTYDELLAKNPQQAYAADMNGNKNLDIADAVAILNIVIDDLNNTKAAPRYLAKDIKMSADNNIALALNGNEDGIREYAVLVNNATTFVAGQLDLKVSAGMEIVDIELTGRAADHELYRFDNSTGARVIVASMSNAALDGNSGALLIVRTRGAGNLEVDGAIFADKHATGFGLGNEGLSGIDSITESCQNVKERIYNVAGQAMNRLQRGINIIRKSDGTTTKEMH